jgi:pentatricopeptide repeat protein
MKELIVAALRRELDGYIRRGRLDRARQVVDQMVLLGSDVSEYLSALDSSTVPPEETANPEAKPAKKAAARKARK